MEGKRWLAYLDREIPLLIELGHERPHHEVVVHPFCMYLFMGADGGCGGVKGMRDWRAEIEKERIKIASPTRRAKNGSAIPHWGKVASFLFGSICYSKITLKGQFTIEYKVISRLHFLHRAALCLPQVGQKRGFQEGKE
jgi:hypothetical protein